MAKLSSKILSAVLLFSAAAACTPEHTVYHIANDVPNSWNHFDTLSWELNVDDSLASYDLYIDIRNSNAYKYQNLGLELTLVSPENVELSHDTIEVMLMDKEGKWKGDGWGSLYQYSFLQERDITFPQGKGYRYYICQAMRLKDIQGISSVGVMLKKK